MREGHPTRSIPHIEAYSSVRGSPYTDGRTEVLRLDGFENEGIGWPGEGDVGLQAAWLAATSADPGEMLAAAVDLDT